MKRRAGAFDFMNTKKKRKPVRRKVKIEQFRDEAGEYRWRFRSSNGKVAFNEGYESKQGQEKALGRLIEVIRNGDFEVVDVNANCPDTGEAR